MNQFCQECGNKLVENQTFCPECGTPTHFENERAETQASPGVQEPAPQVVHYKEKHPMSFKKKISIALISVLAIGLTAGHYAIQAKTSPKEKVDDLLTAIAEKDANAVMAKITVPANTEKNDKAYVEFLSSQDLEELQYRMYETASEVEDDGIARMVMHENGTELFRISQEKFMGLYSVIDVDAITIEPSLNTDLKVGEFQLGAKTFDLSKGANELGSYLPGVYTSVLSTSNGKQIQKLEQEHEFIDGEDATVELLSDNLMIEVWSNKPDSIVYLNGESTGKTVAELPMIGPLADGEEIKVHAESKDEKDVVQKSEVITASAGSFVELPIFAATENEEEGAAAETPEVSETEEAAAGNAEELLEENFLETFIKDFRLMYEDALNNKDFSKVDVFLMEDELAREELVEFIGDLGDDYFLYEFITDNVIEYDIQKDRAFVTTYEEFDFTNHLGEVINYKRNKEYEIVVVDSEFKIVKINILDTKRES